MATQVRSLKGRMVFIAKISSNLAGEVQRRHRIGVGGVLPKIGRHADAAKRRERIFITMHKIKSVLTSRSSKWFVNEYIYPCRCVRVLLTPTSDSVCSWSYAWSFCWRCSARRGTCGRLRTDVGLESMQQCDLPIEVWVKCIQARMLG